MKGFPTLLAHKLHAQGNDFLLIETPQEDIEALSEQLCQLPSRQFGLGADQIILLSKQHHSHFELAILNQDMSKAAFCLNALIATKHFLNATDQLLANTNTSLQLGHAQAWCSKGQEDAVLLDKAFLGPEPYPVALELNNVSYNSFHVEHLNSHLILPCADVHTFDLQGAAKCLQASGRYPDGINLSIYSTHGHKVCMRTFERGVGLTYSCGSAALAVYRTLEAQHPTSKTQSITQPGGTVTFSPLANSEQIMYRGKCQYVAMCHYRLDLGPFKAAQALF